jgi:hypothetical protein
MRSPSSRKISNSVVVLDSFEPNAKCEDKVTDGTLI